MKFLCEENENTQNESWLPSQVAHMCTIWGHINKLCNIVDVLNIILCYLYVVYDLAC
jgi:hypothetical protein